MVYCSVADVRRVAGLDSSHISDQRIVDIRDEQAIPELNQELNYTVEDERVYVIDDEKDNDINGSNKTFYAREVHASKKQIGDRNDDGSVTDADVTGYYITSGDDVRKDVNITLDDAKIGKLTVEQTNGDAIPRGAELYLRYEVAPVDEKTPHPLIKTACAQLTAAYSFTNIEATKLKNFSAGNVSINTRTEGYTTMRSQYRETVNTIIQKDTIKFGENKERIDPFDGEPDPDRRHFSTPR